jgi:cytochrome c peroxidase
MVDGIFTRVAVTALLFPFFFVACGVKPKVDESKPVGEPVAIQSPLGLPPVPIPADNPPTADTIALGRRLYYDKDLSGDNTVACSNCHNPALYFTDGRPVSLGDGGKMGTRNAPTVLGWPRYQPRRSGRRSD